MSVIQSYKKHRYLRATYRALTVFVTSLSYDVESMPGNGGVHISDGSTLFKIRIGKNQTLEDKVICFSHEIGHALDLTHKPFSAEEKTSHLQSLVTSSRYMREVIAWDKAYNLLQDMGCLSRVVERFNVLKMEGLTSYAKAMPT